MMCYSVDYKTPFSPYAQISLYDGDQLIKTLKSLNLREIILAFIQDGKKFILRSQVNKHKNLKTGLNEFSIKNVWNLNKNN